MFIVMSTIVYDSTYLEGLYADLKGAEDRVFVLMKEAEEFTHPDWIEIEQIEPGEHEHKTVKCWHYNDDKQEWWLSESVPVAA